jgi:type IV pilus assembly protein PilE
MRCIKGLTLIEIIIVLVIVSILILAAVPGYQGHMLRVHRGQAVSLLMQAAMCQERIHARTGEYNTEMCILSDENNRYRLSYSTPDIRGQTFTVEASPLGPQRRDACGSLSLDQSGYRQVSGSNKTLAACWSGR